MSQGLISSGQPLSRWQREQQLPGWGWGGGWWWDGDGVFLGWRWGLWGWLQFCCISRWKWAHIKENQLTAAHYGLPAEPLCDTHRQPLCCVLPSLLPEVFCWWFGFVELLLENTVSGSRCSTRAFPYDIHDSLEQRTSAWDRIHIGKRQWFKCEQRLLRLSRLVMQPHEFVRWSLDERHVLPQHLQCESAMCHHALVRDITLIPELFKAGYEISVLCSSQCVWSWSCLVFMFTVWVTVKG